MASLVTAKKKDKILAAIPFFFAIQQFVEGFQWLNLDGGGVSMLAAYCFLFFALIMWPIYTPFAVYMLDKKRHKYLALLVVIGVSVAIFFAILTWLFFHVVFTSVWCFFAAVVSSMFYVYLRNKYKDYKSLEKGR